MEGEYIIFNCLNCNCQGGELTVEQRAIGWWTPVRTVYYVECPDCGMRGPQMESPEGAVTVWNSICEKISQQRTMKEEMTQLRNVLALTEQTHRSVVGAMQRIEQQWRDMAAELEAVGLDPRRVIKLATTARNRKPGGLLSPDNMEWLRGMAMSAAASGEFMLPVDITTLAALLNAVESKEG